MKPSDLIPLQEWEFRVQTRARGDLNHKLRSVLAVMAYYWEISQTSWTEQSIEKYVEGQNKIRLMLAGQKT